jgi:hypothetical protein
MTSILTACSVRCRIKAGLRSGTRVDDLPLWCGSSDSSGIDEVPEWRDWTEQDTTPDQARIEDVLQDGYIEGSVLLHVGFGNSSLAKRFHKTAHAIDGITIQDNEYKHALSLSIPNYTATLANKYVANLASRLNRKYDFIVDNNPTTFCCCRWHLSTMLANYTVMLKPNGVIVTDTVGLHWASEPNDARWRLTKAEWWTLGALFGLEGIQYTSFVIGLRKIPALRSAFHIARSVTRCISFRRTVSD